MRSKLVTCSPLRPGCRVQWLLLELLELDPVPAGGVPGAPGQHEHHQQDDAVCDDHSAQHAALAVRDGAGIVRQPLGAAAEEDDLSDQQALLDVQQRADPPSWFVVNDASSQGDEDDRNFKHYRHGV